MREAIDNAQDEKVKEAIQEEYNKEAAKFTKYNAQYDKFCKDNNLKKLNDRISVAKWNRSEAAKARKASNNAKSVDKSDERGIIDNRKLAMGLRKPVDHILTDEEIRSIMIDAEVIGIDVSILRFNKGNATGFSDARGKINIRGDIMPDITSKIPRDRMSQRAVLAHEYYGHYLNHPSEYEVGDWRDEFRASYDAAVRTPNLTDEDRAYLMLDAYDRAKEAGQTVEYDEVARRIIYGF